MSNIKSSSQETRTAGDAKQTMITLRPVHLSDIDDFMTWATDDRVTKFCTWDSYTSKDQALVFITTTAIPHPWFRAICLGSCVVGTISVSPDSGDRRCTAELGYVVAYEHWGKGIATQAVKIAANVIFDEWPHLQRLEAFVDVDNQGSQRVLEKAGFVRECVLRKYVIVKGECKDMMVFSLLSTDRHLDS